MLSCPPPFLQISCSSKAILAIFKAILYSPSVVLKDKERVTKARDYLAKWLATIPMLLDKSTTIVVALYNAIPRGEIV